MTAPTIVFRADVSGTAFGGAPTWTDYSTYVASAGEGEPIQITWGASDENAEPSARQCTIILENENGRFTPGNANADPDWGVDVRINVRVTYNAVTYDRFDGYIDSIEPAYEGSGWSQVKVTATDATARFQSGFPMHSLLYHEILEDNPVWFFPLAEPSGVRSAGDVQKVAPAATKTNSKYGAGTCEFGTSGPYDDTGVQFDSNNWGTSTTGPMTILRSRPGIKTAAMPASSGGFTIECVVQGLSAPAGSGFSVPLGLFSDDSNVVVKLELLDLTGNGRGYASFVVGTAPGVQSYSDPGVVVGDGDLHHLVGTLAADGHTVAFTIDGVKYAMTADNGSSMYTALYAGLGNILIGGQLLPNGDSKNGVKGVVGYCALYNGVLSDARIQAHAAAALGTGPEERTDQRFSRLLAYNGITASGLPTGQGQVGGQRTNGKTLNEALAQVARTEGTKAWVTGAGAPTFEARNARYWPTAGLSLTGADIDPSFTTRHDRQGKANEASANRDGGATQRFVDTTDQAAKGRFDFGSLEVISSSDHDALDNAAWRVTMNKVPKTRVPSLLVDLLTQTSTTLVANALSATVGTYVALSSLPSQAPASSMNLFIEGGSERIGVEEWSISFFTSPQPMKTSTTTLQTLRADASPSTRTKLDNGLVIPF